MNETKTTSARIKALRTLLHGARERVVRDIEAQIGRRLDETARGRIDAALDLEDRASMDLENDTDFALLEIRYKTYKDIAEAFRRLESGTYGLCERCGADIPIARLEAESFARFCVPCLTAIEAVERVEREEQRFRA
jgi:RNA polymerase-binding protein DksA